MLHNHPKLIMDRKENTPYAVVTGASQGLGKAFAEELAQQQYNLILVSLPNQNLKQLALEIADTYGVKTVYYETDFSDHSNILTLANWLNNTYKVQVLINNAGIGGSKKMEDAQLSEINRILYVNIHATSILTHQLLPNLKQHHKSYILNVSSIAAFSPVGYKTVYPASKSFIHSFSIGLAAELKQDNVFVSVINPGPMKTNEEITSRIEKQGFIGRLTLLEPEQVAKHALKKMFNHKPLILINPMSWFISKLLPGGFKTSLLTKIIKRELQHV